MTYSISLWQDKRIKEVDDNIKDEVDNTSSFYFNILVYKLDCNNNLKNY